MRFSQIEEAGFLEGKDLANLIRPSNSTYIMLMYIVLAMATYLDPNSHKEKSCTFPGWRYLLIAESISLHCNPHIVGELDLDLVRYYTAKAMYMIPIEKLSGAYSAIASAVQLALRIGLNDQSLWTGCSDDEKSTRRLLWWAVYYMDRRVAQKCWRPYFIPESEVGVDEPEKGDLTRYNSSDGAEQISNSDQQPSAVQYIQAQVTWARLWALVWDTFFAVQAKTGDNKTEMVEIMDARIIHNKRGLHQSLDWHTALLPDYIASGETHREILYRLVTFVVRFTLCLILSPIAIFDQTTIESTGMARKRPFTNSSTM